MFYVRDVHDGSLVELDDSRPFVFIIEIAAPRSIIVRKELERIKIMIRSNNMALYRSNRSFKFAETV